MMTEKMNNNIVKNATFTSVWDGGYEVTTGCKVNMETKEVFDIEIEDDPEIIDGLDMREKEYITIDDVDYSVYNKIEYEIDETVFWYE